MTGLSVPALLTVWEGGLDRSPLERALAILEAACPESTQEALAGLSIGQRDAALLALREWAFGAHMAGQAECGSCGESLEMEMTTTQLRQPNESAPAEVSLSLDGYQLLFRPVNSTDLLACAGLDTQDIPRRLLDRCLEASSHGELIPLGQLPQPVAQAAMDHLAAIDPQARLEMHISCAFCGNQWIEVFDIVSFFWSEIDAWARRLLREVHVLASAYGWSEREILLLSPLRRQFYLEMRGT